MTATAVLEMYYNLSDDEKLLFDATWRQYHEEPTNAEFEYLNKLSYRIGVADQLRGINNLDGHPVFPIEWVLRNILKINPEDLTA